MTQEELRILRRNLIDQNSQDLERIYVSYREDCINYLLKRKLCNREEAEDTFTDAVLVLRDNIVSGKISQLSSTKSYLLSTCINMSKEKLTYKTTKEKKSENVRLLLYEKNHTPVEDEITAELLEISQKAFAALSDQCRKIIIAFYIYKIPMKEIAEELEFSSADVAKMTKSRCYKYWLKAVNKIKANYEA